MFTAKHNGDKIQVTFTAEGERTDYGVSGSPVWYDPDLNTIEVTSLTFL